MLQIRIENPDDPRIAPYVDLRASHLTCRKGKIIADKHAYKIYLKEANHNSGFHQGWNTRYITDFAKSVRFYVRGNEFTRQLDYFVDCIEHKQTGNISSFGEALKTDIIMDEIRKDANRTLAAENTDTVNTPVLTKELRQASIWRKLLNSIGLNN